MPESEWTVEVYMREGDVLSLACDVQRPDFTKHFPDAGDALKRMQLPEIYFSIYPINEFGIDDDEEEDEESEDYKTLFAIFGFLKDGQFALRYLSGGDTQLFVDAATKTVKLELLMKITIWGDELDDFEIERLDPLGNIDELFDTLGTQWQSFTPSTSYYILWRASLDAVPPHAPPDNILALSEVAATAGWYPLPSPETTP